MPMSWAIRSLANNEFGASKYDYLVNGTTPGQLVRAGSYYMEVSAEFCTNDIVKFKVDTFILQAYQIQQGVDWSWAGVVYLFGTSIGVINLYYSTLDPLPTLASKCLFSRYFLAQASSLSCSVKRLCLPPFSTIVFFSLGCVVIVFVLTHVACYVCLTMCPSSTVLCS